ncbi:MAG: SAM-dependent methyltransferase [Nocardioides sp.]|nr:SAM-dependent methyltransferase [Nocardioides sp.]
MTHGFDKDYWERHWHEAPTRPRVSGGSASSLPNPHLVREAGGLVPGTALDAGCGEGAEAIWLAARGWDVTAADISAEALARAAERAGGVPVRWVEADLSAWAPDVEYDLVTTHYAHPAMPQLEFYDRIAGWVALGGTLLVVGHLHTPDSPEHGHGHHPPAEASVTLADITARLDGARWEVVTAEEHVRTTGHATPLHDVVVRATRAVRV